MHWVKISRLIYWLCICVCVCISQLYYLKWSSGCNYDCMRSDEQSSTWKSEFGKIRGAILCEARPAFRSWPSSVESLALRRLWLYPWHHCHYFIAAAKYSCNIETIIKSTRTNPSRIACKLYSPIRSDQTNT